MPWRLGVLGAWLLLLSCAGGRAPQQGSSTVEVVPDSLRAKLLLRVPTPDSSEEELSAVLWAVPQQRYRLEISGTLGVQVASLLWLPHQWLALFPTESRFVQGKGEVVRLPGLVMPAIPVHRLLRFVWDPDCVAEERFQSSQGAEWDLRFQYGHDSLRVTQGGRWLMSLAVVQRKPQMEWGAGVWKLKKPDHYQPW